MGRETEQNPRQDEPKRAAPGVPDIKDPPSDLPDYTDPPEPTNPQDPTPPPIKSHNRYDPNDLQNYVRDPFESVREPYGSMYHIRDPLPSETPYRL